MSLCAQREAERHQRHRGRPTWAPWSVPDLTPAQREQQQEQILARWLALPRVARKAKLTKERVRQELQVREVA